MVNRMHLSEIRLVAQFLDEKAKGAFVNNIYRSMNGVLIKLYGAELDGIYFNAEKKVIFPVKDLKKYERQTITRLEEGLRANISGRIKNIKILDRFGKLVCIETTGNTLYIPLFSSSVYIKNDSGVLWKEKEKADLPEEMPQEMRHIEPMSEDPFFYEKEFFENIEKRKTEQKEKFLQKKKRKLDNLLKKLMKELKGKDVLEKQSLENGTMLRNNLYLFDANKRMEKIEVCNSNGTQTKLSLDPKMTVVENMEKFFKIAKKLKAGRNNLLKRIDVVKEELSGITVEDVEVREQGETSHRKNPKQSKHVPYHRFETEKGRVFLVGKDSKDNDELTFKISSPHDMWFHAKDHAGSHVILKMKRNEALQADDLLTGCVLALMYSKAKKDMSGEVWYTQRKNLTKKKGMAAGKVMVKNGKSKYIRNGKLPDKVRKVD